MRLCSENTQKVEEGLVKWVKQASAMKLPVSGPVMATIAKGIAQNLSVEFEPNTGWLRRFKKELKIHSKLYIFIYLCFFMSACAQCQCVLLIALERHRIAIVVYLVKFFSLFFKNNHHYREMNKH